MFFKRLCDLLLTFIMSTLTIFIVIDINANDVMPQVKFEFRKNDSGYIKNKGKLKFKANISSRSSGGSGACFIKTKNGYAFNIGSKTCNCIITDKNVDVDNVFSKGFSVKLGYTMPHDIAELRDAKHVQTLIAKYDNGTNKRTFSITTNSRGGLKFEVSPNGQRVIGCGKHSLVPGKRAVIEACFAPGKEIVLYVDGKKAASRKVSFSQLYQSDVPVCIGARLHHGKPINFGEGLIDFVEINPLAHDAEQVVSDANAVPAIEKQRELLQAPNRYKKAFHRDNGMRGEICLNGLWQWQPQMADTQDVPDEKNWFYRRVPSDRNPAFKVKDTNGKTIRKYKKKKLNGKEKGWYATEINIPESWKNRDIYFEVQGVYGEKPVVILNNKRMIISPDIPYKFPLEYTNGPVKLRIKAAAIKQNVWLRSYPKQDSIRYAGVAPSWRQKNLNVYTEGVCKPEDNIYARILVAEKPDCNDTVKESAWHKINTENRDFDINFKMPWKNPKEWTPDTPNLYYFVVELKNGKNELIDRTLPLRFGFREIWTENGRLKLNGKNINLRGNNHTPFGSKSSYAAYTGNRDNIEWILKKWKNETNVNSFLIWSQAKHGMPDKSKVLDVADELGMLVVYQLPPGQRDFADNETIDKYNRRLLTGEIKRYAHHPSVFAWNLGSSHYTWTCAPGMLGQKFEPEKHWNKVRKQTDYFLPKKEMIKNIDPSRVFTTHSGGHNKVTDLFTGMVYINPDAGLDERANWPLAWWKNRKNLKPLFLTEISCIFWGTFYQRKAANSFPAKNSEPIFLEHGAELFGENVYQDEPEKFIERYFGKKQAISLYWAKEPSPIIWDFKREYLKYAFRAWRTYGVGFFLHIEIRPGFDNRRFPEFDKDKINIQTPGLYPDNQINGNESTGDLNKWGKDLQEQLAPFYAYIGGDGNFTSQDHAYFSGEPIVKRGIVLNDHFYSLPVDVEWTLIDSSGKVVFTKRIQKNVPAGKRAIDMFRLQFMAPDVNQKTHYTLNLKVESNGNIRKDSLVIQVFPRIKAIGNNDITLNVFDPIGETRAMLDCAGFKIKDITDKLSVDGILVIGRHVLEKKYNVEKLQKMGFDQKLANGMKVVVFEQACNNILGLNAYERSPRRTFICAKGHPVLSGISNADMSYWRGESDLIEPYPVPQQIPSAAGGWFPERFWKWGNDNNVATYVIQKPMKGAFRALVNSGFDLMDTPLLESCKGKGRILFCQLDVTKRYGVDPTATNIVNNMFRYMTNVSLPDRKLTEVKYEKGNALFDGFRIRKPKGELGWGMNNGDFYFRKKVSLPAFDSINKLELIKLDGKRPVISFQESDLQTNWQKYKYFKIVAALRVNQGGSSNTGISTELHGDSDELYPVNWHFGFVHPYTGWCW